MRRVLIGLLLVICVSCKRDLPPGQVELLDAVMFAATGVEENSQEKYGVTPWMRQVTENGIELSMIAKNGIGTSDDKLNALIRKSVFVKYVKSLSSPEPCVFRLEEATDFSRKNSKTDFSSYHMDDGTDSHIFDLTKAYKLVISAELGSGKLVIEGPGAVCWIDGGCENSWESYPFDAIDADDKPSRELIRRSDAVAFIKKSCPGKPF